MLQQACRLVIEPIFEAQFLPNSFGFRPRRSAKDASLAIWRWLNFGCVHVVDADVRDCLDPASHCPLGAGEGVQQPPVGLGDLDTQAFSPSGADVDGA